MTLKHANPIDAYTRLVGLVGWPLERWPSPRIYNAAFQALGLNWRCVPLPVEKKLLREALRGLHALGFAGAELTKPFQRDAPSHLQELTPAAETIGAVKFIKVNERGWLVGDNVCWLGFLATLRSMVPSLNGLRPLIIGAGDAARSIAYALTGEGLPVTIISDRMEQGVDLVHRLRHVVDEHSFSVYRWPEDLERVASEVNLIVNATSMGTWPEVERSPWPDGLPLPTDALVFDLVAWPSETRFLRKARASGARTVNGVALLVYEAALAFEEWTGHAPPIEAMWRVAGESLREDTSREMPWNEHRWEGMASPRLT